MNFEQNLIEYRKITITILDTVKSEEYEKLDGLFNERQLLLDNIKSINYTGEELKKLYYQYEIDKLDRSLFEEMKTRKDELLNKIKENKKRQTGMMEYNNLSVKAVFLSKEI